MVSTVNKGNKLEDKFHEYLLSQQRRRDFVFGAYPPELCVIHKKKKYYCREREGDVEFDVVIELYRKGSSTLHLAVVFECKNHDGNIQGIHVNDFSAKLSSIFKHAAKGVMVVSSQLQSGAANVAKNSKIGIVKYDQNGFEIIADRKSGIFAETEFVKTQIVGIERPIKSLKFSAIHEGKYFGSIDHFLWNLAEGTPYENGANNGSSTSAIPFISDEHIMRVADSMLAKSHYSEGPVALKNLCKALNISLKIVDDVTQDDDGNVILGSANFDRKVIQINSHDNKQRERFTLAHEIGHFALNHGRFLRSETVLERDLLADSEKANSFNLERLEIQANAFASHLLLPKDFFVQKVAQFRRNLDIRDRGHGYIFVDNQPCNYQPYGVLLSNLSSHFDVSKQAIEIKLNKLRMLTDRRQKNDFSPISNLM